jgi:cyclic pyranopterin phosphate synthase
MLAENKETDVRFIEMMPIGCGKNIRGISNEDIYNGIIRHIGELKEDKEYHGNGPAVYYRIDGFKGAIGFISAVHKKFCNKCNRIRLSADGTLKGCLCYGSDISVIGRKDYKELIRQVIESKPKEHCFENYDEVTEENSMFRIGG